MNHRRLRTTVLKDYQFCRSVVIVKFNCACCLRFTCSFAKVFPVIKRIAGLDSRGNHTVKQYDFVCSTLIFPLHDEW